MNDCCETATYVPNRELGAITHNHHWREGNLPTNSKCHQCKKTCWTAECLAGMKCEWCGIATHSICRGKIIEDCNFGTLRDIIVPPFAVSVPRIDIDKETIFGIPINRPKVRNNSGEWASSEFKQDSNSDSASTVVAPTANTSASSTASTISASQFTFSNTPPTSASSMQQFALATPSGQSSNGAAVNPSSISPINPYPAMPFTSAGAERNSSRKKDRKAAEEEEDLKGLSK